MSQTIMDFIGTAANLKTTIGLGGTGFTLSNLGAYQKLDVGGLLFYIFSQNFDLHRHIRSEKRR